MVKEIRARGHVTHFGILGPPLYLGNGWS